MCEQRRAHRIHTNSIALYNTTKCNSLLLSLLLLKARSRIALSLEDTREWHSHPVDEGILSADRFPRRPSCQADSRVRVLCTVLDEIKIPPGYVRYCRGVSRGWESAVASVKVAAKTSLDNLLIYLIADSRVSEKKRKKTEENAAMWTAQVEQMSRSTVAMATRD